MVVCSRTEDEINSVAQEISKVTGNSSVLGIKCDVSIPSAVNSLVKATIEKFESKTIAYNNDIRVLTIFLGEVATKMWQEFDFSYYEKNKSKMLRPTDVAAKIVEMIFDAKAYKSGDSFEMYTNT